MPNIKEIFLSVQGEGPYIGYRQLFVRFCGCNLNCDYCDTDFSVKDCYVEYLSGSGVFDKIRNPIEDKDLVEIIRQFRDYHSISLTGGEPLLAYKSLQSLLPKLNKKIYLETNGTLPEQLAQVVNLVDIIAMDIKIPSSTGLKSYLKEHYEFIDVALKAKKEIFAKAVVSEKISRTEIEYLNQVSKKIPIIIQPITTKDEGLILSKKKLFQISEKIPSARIIPQTHNYLNIL